MSSDQTARQQLVRMLEERAFDPVLSVKAERYSSDSDKQKLADVQRSTESEKRRFRDEYKSASDVRNNYLSDLHSEAGKKKTRELEQLGLPTLPSIKDEFLARCDELGIGRS
jgi:hypothetical protein